MIGEWLKNHNPFNEPEWEIPDIVDDLKRELYYSELKGVERTKLVYKLCNAYNLLSISKTPKNEGKWVWVEKDES